MPPTVYCVFPLQLIRQFYIDTAMGQAYSSNPSVEALFSGSSKVVTS